jgi:predicted  nucleic acid-binding Zn-ribbon protein
VCEYRPGIEEEMQASQRSAPAVAASPTLCLPVKKKLDDIHQRDGKPEEKTLESVKITAPGTYELNLPSLFERDELIMAVKEGTYFIDLASVFKKSKKD